jgi:hypothetical protein
MKRKRITIIARTRTRTKKLTDSEDDQDGAAAAAGVVGATETAQPAGEQTRRTLRMNKTDRMKQWEELQAGVRQCDSNVNINANRHRHGLLRSQRSKVEPVVLGKQTLTSCQRKKG